MSWFACMSMDKTELRKALQFQQDNRKKREQQEEIGRWIVRQTNIKEMVKDERSKNTNHKCLV